MNKKEHKDLDLDLFATGSSIITLTPKKEIIKKLESICNEEMNLDKTQLHTLLGNDGLEKHAFPVITPQFKTTDELTQFEITNCSLLIDMMLSTWPFPSKCWGYHNKDMELFKKIVEVRYYPCVLNFIAKMPHSTLELAALFFKPNTNLISYLTECIESGKLKPNKDESMLLDIVLNYGIAIVCNQLDSKKAEKQPDWRSYMFNPKNYLHSQNIKILESLFTILFHEKENWPNESNDDYLDKWFDTQVLIQGIANLKDPNH